MESALPANASSTRSDRRRDLGLTVLLFAAVWLAYLPAQHGGRLLDDDLHITRPELQSLGGLGRIWFEIGATQQYYPVVHTAFWLEHRLWGDSVAGYHRINVLLHLAAALLVVALMRRLRLPGAWLAAFLFALHPVCVESVAWIAEQKNTLSTVFALGAAIAYLDFDRERERSRYGLALGWFALALLSKTAVVTLPFALLVVVWWRRARLEWRRDVWPLLPWVALGAASSLITLAVERRLLAGLGAQASLPFAGRVLLAGRAFWFYLGKLVWPAGLTFFYPRWTVSSHAGWQWLYPAAMGALGVILWRLARRTRGPLAAFLCFAGTLAPVLGFFNVEWFVFSYVADHLQYQACLGIILPLAAVLASGAARSPTLRRLAPAGAAAVAALLGILTWRQCARYADPVTFYRTAAELNPTSPAAYDNWGTALSALPGRLPEAIARFETVVRLDPNSPRGQEDLGTVLLPDPARREEAAAHLEAALRLGSDRKSTHDMLAFALFGLPGRLPDAIAQYQASLRIDPSDASVHNDLGLALSQTPGGLQGAIAHYETALRLNPNLAETHNNLGLALEQARRPEEATVQFEAAVRLKPDFVGAHNNLGLALALTPGRMNQALAEFQEAVRLDPNFAAGWHSLGIVWVKTGNLTEAAAAFRHELRLSPDNTEAQQALDAVLQQAGGH